MAQQAGVPTSRFASYKGIITEIVEQMGRGCTMKYTMQTNEGQIINFIIDKHTYFVNNAPIYEGMEVEIFYDTNMPVPLIYPPQYKAVVVATVIEGRFVKVDWFNWVLVSRDRTLKLNIDENTPIYTENGQPFRGNPGNRNLIVLYSNTTRSIPAQTTPEQVIVMC